MHRRYENANIPIEMLRTLVTISDCGSFTKAAERLHLTQSAVSAQVKRLQQIVGDELFEKVGAGQILNERGVAVAKVARRMLGMNDQILAMSGSRRVGDALRVGVPAIFGGEIMSTLLSSIASHRSGDNIQFFSDTSDELVKSLQSGYADLAFLFAVPATGFITIAEWEEQLVWICSRDFVLSLGAPIPLVVSQNAQTSRVARNAMEETGRNYAVVFSGIDQASCFAAVRAGMGFVAASERFTPAGLKISDDYFLPPLPAVTCGLYAREGLESKSFKEAASRLLKLLPPQELPRQMPARRMPAQSHHGFAAQA